jgi:alkylhydroperoxidase family enzyme
VAAWQCNRCGVSWAISVVNPHLRNAYLELENSPLDLRERVGVIAEKSGFVPNIFRGLARRSAELRAFLDYHDALMDSEDGLSKAERELVVVATSGVNRCTSRFAPRQDAQRFGNELRRLRRWDRQRVIGDVRFR